MVSRSDAAVSARQSLIETKGRAILERLHDISSGFWSRQLDRVMRPFIEDESFRIQGLRFIDVLPRLDEDEALLHHCQQYFDTDALRLPLPFKWCLHKPGLYGPLIVQAVRRFMGVLSGQFMGGATPDEAMATIESLRRREMGFSLDILGEAVVSEQEADSYQKHYLKLIEEITPRLEQWPFLQRIDEIDAREGPLLYLSLKVTSLYSQINPLDVGSSVEGIIGRLRPILLAARRNRVFVCIDMEQYEFKEIVLECFKTVLTEPELVDWCDVGVAMQAYLRESEQDVKGMIEWARSRGAPVTIRLVRGAYWDFEIVVAKQQGWPVPVWEEKRHTDACYERCLELLMGHYPTVRTAVATHNIRSLALAMVLAEEYGLSADQFEFQMLFGMAEALQRVISDLGYCLRIYVPFGEAIPGMAYLVRRLLENASNQSFLRMGVSQEYDPDQVLAPPASGAAASAVTLDVSTGNNRADSDSLPDFRNEPLLRFNRAEERRQFAAAIGQVRGRLGEAYPLFINGSAMQTGSTIESHNPAWPQELVGIVAAADAAHADLAVEGAAAAFADWSARSMEQRARLLLCVAARLRAQRGEFAAWEILEAGKTWREADADVTEAIDFLEYYARRAIRLGCGGRLDLPGEQNLFGFRPLGVGVVIPPWNFPLAILTGMLSAAIVTGNTVIVKPSSQTPVIAARFVRLLHETGLPGRVVQFLPGAGGTVGEHLVKHPDVHFIAFTGSEAIGTRIIDLASNLAPGQHHIKRVVAEMGGKNAIIVDDDADLDDAVVGVIRSAFGYQGQKCSACSRLIIIGAQYDELLERLIEAACSLKVGMPEEPGSFLGPVIDLAAKERILKVIEQGRKVAQLALHVDCSAVGPGYFVGPTIFSRVPPDSDLAQKEVFGPVLSVMEADTLDEALATANDSSYALTGGFYSRSPANIERVKGEFQVGNLYINRPITGALVQRQPFGGFRLSGTGSKAGGPDYLKQFLNPCTVTENTLRRGFAPST
jgi:RHH-type transcriptional regulator, proline utilization regulon repressor / proline dehydrogenase / delta 1-pyrroline-5-carboxylate dehydrogenase